jgi:hypothetical protein
LCKNFSFYTTTAEKQQNAGHFAETCLVTNRVIKQIHYVFCPGFSSGMLKEGVTEEASSPGIG